GKNKGNILSIIEGLKLDDALSSKKLLDSESLILRRQSRPLENQFTNKLTKLQEKFFWNVETVEFIKYIENVIDLVEEFA
ncbi:MAG TPA: hypothetical protein PLS50_09055, partial [Candidatus Dojkabacteria bacterium]|nr:hypothetical protein [Candidatus Dojkabacteria bacterium]